MTGLRVWLHPSSRSKYRRWSSVFGGWPLAARFCTLDLRPFFRPFGGLVALGSTQGLRPGLYSFAASRLTFCPSNPAALAYDKRRAANDDFLRSTALWRPTAVVRNGS